MAWTILLSALALVQIFRPATSQVFSVGNCPNVTPILDFDVAAYLGKWYEIEKFQTLFQIGGRCATAMYSATDDPNTIGVVNRERGILGSRSIAGTASFVGDPLVADLKVVFPSIPFSQLSSSNDGNYKVLATDYNTYSIVYSCSTVLPFFKIKSEFLWILARDSTISEDLNLEIRSQILNFGIDATFLTKTDQSCTNTILH